MTLIDFKGGYRFGGNPEEIFEKFFGTNNPFSNLIGTFLKLSHLLDQDGSQELGSLFGFAFGGLNYSGIRSVPTLEVVVECTLNELYNGCSKKVTYTRTVLNGDGQTTKDVQETK